MKDKILFVLLIALFLFVRLYPIWGGNFPFAFDNAKDSLVLMQAWIFHKPPLLGAVTSLEGLSQGPFWYYVLLPLNIIFRFDPFASVLTVIILGILTTWLFWKYLGKLEAFLYSISILVITTQQTAWSPYLTMFSSAWTLVILAQIKDKIKTKQLVLISFFVSIAFHAEIAFAIVFAILVILIFVLRKIKPSLKQIGIAIFTFLVTFIPQLFFEVRHNFLQTRSVIRFITNFYSESSKIQSNLSGLARFNEVLTFIKNNGIESVLPYRVSLPHHITDIVILLVLVLLIISKNKNVKIAAVIILTIVFGTLIFYQFLPVKAFYLVALTPFWIYAFSLVWEERLKNLTPFVVILFTILAIQNTVSSKADFDNHARGSRILFEQKKEAVDAVYKLANGSPFASYQYVPEIYDYTYQHIFQYTSLTEKRNLPTEYSYLPGEYLYMQTQKLTGPKVTPVYTMLIVEREPQDIFFQNWWDQITKGKKIINQTKINDLITAYQLVSDRK